MKTFFYWSIYWFCSFFLLWIFTLKLFVDNFLWKEMKRNCLFKNKSWLVLISDILQYLKCTWNYQKCDFMGSLRQKFSPKFFVWTVWAESVFALASMSMLLFFYRNQTSLVNLQLLTNNKKVEQVVYGREYTLRADITHADGKILISSKAKKQV